MNYPHDLRIYDLKFINLAINLSKKNIGLTASNPSVGCVITKNNIIISTGVTGKSGIPHAESIAINKAKEKIQNSTLYVTLEPCSHFAKTSPCADLIIKSGISRVVIATEDPDERVNEKGIKKLKEAGIEVVVGILRKKAQEINYGFFTARKTKLPYVTLKLATSKDEKIADQNYHSKWITNEESRKYGHYLRAKNEAILVGSNTVKYDNPRLDCRILGLENYSPKKIIISNDLNLNIDSNIFNEGYRYIATKEENKGNCQKFIDRNIEIIFCRSNNENQIDLKDLLQKLCKLGINSLLVEGGSKTATSFLKNNLVNKMVWAQNTQKIIGENGIRAVDTDILKSISEVEKQPFDMTKVDERRFGDDLIRVYQSRS